MTVKEPAASASRLLNGLSGERIARVVYREVLYESGEPACLRSDHHSIDHGVELFLESGRVVSFLWKWPPCYYLGVLAEDLSGELTGEHSVRDVSSVHPWPELVHRRIESTYLEWFEDEDVDGHVPFTAKLLVEPGASLHVPLGVGDESDDQLAILFSDEAARRHGRFLATSGVRRTRE